MRPETLRGCRFGITGALVKGQDCLEICSGRHSMQGAELGRMPELSPAGNRRAASSPPPLLSKADTGGECRGVRRRAQHGGCFVDVFQVPDQSCARIAQPRGRRPAAQLQNSVVYGVQSNSAETVTFGDLATQSTLHFAIEHCNKAQPVPLGRLKLRSKKKDKHDSVRSLLSKLRPGQRAVACVRGVALLRWQEGDEWATYHLLPLWTLDRHQDTVLPLLLRVLGWLPADTAAPFPDPPALPRTSLPPFPGLPTIAIAAQPPPQQPHRYQDPYALPLHVGLCRGVINFRTADWAAVNEQGRTVCYRDPMNFHLDPWTAPFATDEEEEDTIKEMLAPEHEPEFMLQAKHLLHDVAVHDPANPSQLWHVSLSDAVDIVKAHGPGALFWRLHNLQAVDNVLHLELLLGSEDGDGASQSGSQGGGWEARVHEGQQLELWTSSAEGAPFLVVQAVAAGRGRFAGGGTSEDGEHGDHGDGSNEEELHVVGELGEERLGVLRHGAGGTQAGVAVTLAPAALKMVVGCYSGDVIFSRAALREGEELLGRLLGGLPAVEEAVIPGEEEVGGEGAPGPAVGAPQQQQVQVQQRQPQGLVEVFQVGLNEGAQRRSVQEGAQRQDGQPGSRKRSRRSLSRVQAKVCTNCSTTDAKFWRTDKQGNRLCNACGLYYQKNGVARPPHMWEADAVRPGSRASGPQRQPHGHAGGGGAGRGKNRGAVPPQRRPMPRGPSEDAVSSESGMEDGDDVEESDGSDVDNDGNYYAGNAHKRAHLDPGTSTGMVDAVEALVGLAAGASPQPGTQQEEEAGMPGDEATPRHGTAQAAAEAQAAGPRPRHGPPRTEQRQGSNASEWQLPNGEKQAGPGAGGRQRGLHPVAGELGDAAQRVDRLLDTVLPPGPSREGSSIGPFEAREQPWRSTVQQQEQQQQEEQQDQPLSEAEHEQQSGHSQRPLSGRRLQLRATVVGSGGSTPGLTHLPNGLEAAAPPDDPVGPAMRLAQPPDAPAGAAGPTSPAPAAAAAQPPPHGHVAPARGGDDTAAHRAAAPMAIGADVGRSMDVDGLHSGAGGSEDREVVQVEQTDLEMPEADTGNVAPAAAAAAVAAAAAAAAAARGGDVGAAAPLPDSTDVQALRELVGKLQSERKQMVLQMEAQKGQLRGKERDLDEQRRKVDSLRAEVTELRGREREREEQRQEADEQKRRGDGLQAEVEKLQEENREAVGALQDEQAARERFALEKAGEIRVLREALAAAEAREAAAEGRCKEVAAARDLAEKKAEDCRRQSGKDSDARRAAEQEAQNLRGRVKELEEQLERARERAEKAEKGQAEAQSVTKRAQEHAKRLQDEVLKAFDEKEEWRKQKKTLSDQVHELEGKLEAAKRRALEADKKALEAQLAAK